MITIKEIAEKLEVSPTTVSNVINGHTEKMSAKTEQRIREVLEETNYTPRMGLRALNKGSSQIIGVVLYPHREHENTPFADPFYSQVVGVLEEKMHDYEYFMMVYSTNRMNDIYKMVAGWNVDGVIALCFTKEEYRILEKLIQKPVVGIDIETDESVSYSVGIDDEEACYHMAISLLQTGYRKIKVFVYADSHMDHVRSEAVRRAVRDFGDSRITFEKVIISSCQKERLDVIDKMYKKATGDTLWFFLRDATAIETMHYLKNKNVNIPEELGIVGFDDIDMASNAIPPLTTIHQNVARKAELALNMLMKVIKGEDVAEKNIVLPTYPVIRKSTRRIKR